MKTKKLEKTLLVFAMPGTGKSWLVRKLNEPYKMDKRPAIDFDYRAIRLKNKTVKHDEICEIQSQLLNSYADCKEVHVICTFPTAVKPQYLDLDKYRVVFVLPTPDAQSAIVERCKQRSDKPDTDNFIKDYTVNIDKYCFEWHDCCDEYVKRGFDTSLYLITKDQFVSDVYDIERGRLKDIVKIDFEVNDEKE